MTKFLTMCDVVTGATLQDAEPVIPLQACRKCSSGLLVLQKKHGWSLLASKALSLNTRVLRCHACGEVME